MVDRPAEQPARARATLGLRHLARMLPVFIEPGHRAAWIALAAMALVVTAIEVASALAIFVLVGLVTDPTGSLEIPLVGSIRERFPELQGDRLLVSAAAVIAAFFVIRAAVVLLQTHVRARITEATGVRLSSRLVRGYLSMPYPLYLQRNSAELIRNISDAVNDVVEYTLAPSIRLGSELLVVAGLALTLVVTAPLAAVLAAGIFGPLMWLLFRLIRPKMTVLGEETHRLTGSALLSLQQSLHGFRDITILGRAEWFHARYVAIRRAIARIRASRWLLGEVPRIALETSLVLFVAAFIGVSIGFGSSAADSLPVLGMFAYAALRMLPSLNHVVLVINDIRYGTAAATTVHHDLIGLDARRDATSMPSDDSLLPFHHEIRLEGVTYRYPGESEDALADINLEIRSGTSMGIVGPTGAGKSTLIDVILGLLPPATGRVLVDGTDIHSDLAGWQRQIGMVPQSVYLLDDTLRRNIALGEEDETIDDERLRDAVSLAQLDVVVASLPSGLETVVGERGARLSGGERQRVAIARALYRHPFVLIMDEGTAALDTATESAFLDALASSPHLRSLIIVAHRLSSVRRSDDLVIVDAGRIVEAGRFDELYERSAAFRRMLHGTAASVSGSDGPDA